MKNITLFSLIALVALGTSLRAAESKLTGEASCAKCALNVAIACQAAITVTGADGKKEVILADKNAVAKGVPQARSAKTP